MTDTRRIPEKMKTQFRGLGQAAFCSLLIVAMAMVLVPFTGAQTLPKYELTWIEGPNANDDTRVYDVSPDGVAVGQLRPGGLSAGRYGTIFFPGRPLLNFEALAKDGQYAASDEQVITVYSICDGLLVGGDLIDSSGQWRTYAAQLKDDGTTTTIEWFKLFQGPAGTSRSYLQDASENGMFLMELTVNGVGEFHLWRPRDNWSMLIPDGLFLTNLNNDGYSASGRLDSLVMDLVTGDFAMLEEDPSFDSRPIDISDEGTVVGSITELPDGVRTPARWNLDGWRPLAAGSGEGTATSVNNAVQICGYVTEPYRLFLFSDEIGFHWMNDLLVPGQDTERWDGDWRFYEETLRISDPNESGFGSIAGHRFTNTGWRAFVLTPQVQNEGAIYYVSEDREEIYRAGLDGSEAGSLIALDAAFGGGTYSPTSIVVLGERVYWVDTDHPGWVFSAKLDGTDPKRDIDLVGGFGITSRRTLAVSGGRLVVDSADGIYAYDVEAGTVEKLATPGGSVQSLAMAGSTPFWIQAYEDIYRGTQDPGTAEEILDLDARFGNTFHLATALAVSDSALYWSDQAACCSGVILTANVDGSDPRELLDIPDDRPAKALTVAGGRIYWSARKAGLSQANAIYSAAFDGSDIQEVVWTSTPNITGLAVHLPSSSTPTPPQLALTAVESVASTPFVQTWRVGWTSQVGDYYRVLVSRDLQNWTPSSEEAIPSQGTSTEAEVVLPREWREAYFRVELQE